MKKLLSPLDNAVGLLKEEMRRLGSIVMRAADANQVPAGSALAVDRNGFAAEVTREQFARDYPTTIPHLHHALGDALEFEEQLRPMLIHAGRL